MSQLAHLPRLASHKRSRRCDLFACVGCFQHHEFASNLPARFGGPYRNARRLGPGRRFGEGKEFGAHLNLVKRDDETSIDNQKRDLSVLAAGMDYDGDKLRFSADVGYQDQKMDVPRPQVTPGAAIPAPPSADVNFVQPWTYSNERQVFGVVRGEYDFTDHVTAWAAISAFRFDNTREDGVVSADAGIRADFDTGAVGHRVIVSGSAVSLKSKNAFAFGAFGAVPGTLSNPVAIPQPANVAGAGVLSNPLKTEENETSSFAVADLISLFDGAAMATIGARYQEIDVRTFDHNTGLQASQYKSDAVTPAIGVVYKPMEWLSVYGNYSEAQIPGGVAPQPGWA